MSPCIRLKRNSLNSATRDDDADMLIPDVNILIYAHRREDPDHEFHRFWLEELANGTEPFAMSTLVGSAFVRIVRHPGFRPRPTPLPQALSVIDSILRVPSCSVVPLGEHHWRSVRGLCETVNARGKLVADAQHAAVAMANGCTWVTRDTDFEHFRSAGLRVKLLTRNSVGEVSQDIDPTPSARECAFP
jgi:toxin-antitoxin system PIN domain toxin